MATFGMVVSMSPGEHVKVREVGPRDGFQNEPEVIPTDAKVRLIDMLARTGLERLEVTSFVRADVIPQLRVEAALFWARSTRRPPSRCRSSCRTSAGSTTPWSCATASRR